MADIREDVRALVGDLFAARADTRALRTARGFTRVLRSWRAARRTAGLAILLPGCGFAGFLADAAGSSVEPDAWRLRFYSAVV